MKIVWLDRVSLAATNEHSSKLTNKFPTAQSRRHASEFPSNEICDIVDDVRHQSTPVFSLIILKWNRGGK